jgi:hypothetical protein
VTTIKTDPPPLSFADHGTTSYTSGPNIMHRDHSAWVREAVGEAGRVRAASLPSFWSSNRRVGVVVSRSRSTMVLSRGVLGKLQTPRSLQEHLKHDNQLLTKRGASLGLLAQSFALDRGHSKHSVDPTEWPSVVLRRPTSSLLFGSCSALTPSLLVLVPIRLSLCQ